MTIFEIIFELADVFCSWRVFLCVLPAVLLASLLATAAQLAAAGRLGEKSALVRNGRSIEALGRINVICLDKTGTLTEGRISLVFVTDGKTQSEVRELAGSHLHVLEIGQSASPAYPRIEWLGWLRRGR